jgi:hypothetical protein
VSKQEGGFFGVVAATVSCLGKGKVDSHDEPPAPLWNHQPVPSLVATPRLTARSLPHSSEEVGNLSRNIVSFHGRGDGPDMFLREARDLVFEIGERSERGRLVKTATPSHGFRREVVLQLAAL